MLFLPRSFVVKYLLAGDKLDIPRNSIKYSHTFVKPEGRGRKKIRICLGCYLDLRKTLSIKEAHHNSRRVTSFCYDCDNQPGFCQPCFYKFH